MKKTLFLLAAAAASLGANDGIFRYDFGRPDSPLRPGYTLISPKKGAAYQWRTQGKLSAAANKIIDQQANKRRQSIEPPPVYFTDLTCDHVSGNSDAELILKVPAGRYMAWALCGPAGRPNNPFVWNIRLGSENVNNNGKFNLSEITFPVTADRNGAVISIKTGSSWLLNAMILVPEKKWTAFKKGEEFRALWQEIFVLPADKLKKWKQIPQPIIRPALKVNWNDRQKKDGFGIFRRGFNDPLFPNELPRQEEIDQPLRCFAAGNELESLTFTVHALKDINSVSVQTADLTGPGGKLKAPEVRYIRYMLVRPHYTILDRYFEAPDIVMPYRKAMALEKGRNLRFWLTVKVPAGTKAGTYSGKVTLKCDGVTKVLPLTVKVLGFDLKRDPSKIYSIYYNMPMPEMGKVNPYTRAWLSNKREKELAQLQESGFTGITLGFWATKRKGSKDIFILFDRFRHSAALLRKYGITAPVPASYGEGRLYADNMKLSLPSHLTGMIMPNEQYFKDVEHVFKTILAEYKKNPSWPEPLIYLTDEPDCTPTVVAYLKRLGEIVKRCGGRTYVTADPANKLFAPLFDVVDVWAPSQFTLTPAQIKEWQKKRPGTEFWCYPNSVCGSNNHVTPAGARMTFGYGFWKSEFKALIPWMYQSSGGSQWNYLDAARMDFLNRTDNDGSPIPAMNFLCYREGIDDARYIYTLQTKVAEAKKKGLSAAAAEGSGVLKELSDAIPAQRRYKDHNDGVWDTGTMDAWRWKIAQAIMKIDAALKAKGGRK